MKKREIKSLPEKSLEELKKMLEEQTKKLVEIRLKLKGGKLKNIHEVTMRRRDIARIKTIISQKNLAMPLSKAKENSGGKQ